MNIFNPIIFQGMLLVALVGSGPARAADYIPVSEITRGMHGYGLTVFEGSRVDTFGVEVIGIQEHSRVKGNLILIKVSGHDLETSSIAQGMSGSPIYLDGRFAGALAFGWAGSLSPIAGVTPARDILGLPRVAEGRPAVGQLSASGSAQNLKPLLVTDDQALDLAATLLGVSSGQPVSDNRSEPWPRPDVLIGDLMGRAGISGLENWYCNPAGSLSRSKVSPPAGGLTPGSACAVPLVTGDAMLGVIGTVTWTGGQDVLMMGHPFMQRGPVDLPLATASMLTVLPSRQMSFKMGSVGSIVGTVHHDLRAGLAGKLGPAPVMIPVVVTVALADASERKYDFEVVDDPLLTPSLVFWTLYNSLLTEGDDASSQNVSYEVTSHWRGPGFLADQPLVLRGVAAGPGGAQTLAKAWMAPFSLLLDNPFQDVTLESVQARLTLSRPESTALITGLDAPRSLAPGSESLPVQVELNPRLEEKQLVTVDLPLPADLKAGSYRLVAASAAEFFTLEAQRAPARFQSTSLDGTVAVLSMARAADDLVVALLSPGRGLLVQDHQLNHLPGRVAHLLQQGNMQIKPTLADFAARQTKTLPFALQGYAVRKVRIRSGAEPIKEDRRP